jgi:hypothetical protein
LAEYGIQDLIDKSIYSPEDADGNTWTFKDALAAYGTEEWDNAKASAE